MFVGTIDPQTAAQTPDHRDDVSTSNPSDCRREPQSNEPAVPWVEYQAEAGVTNARIIGPSRQKWDAAHIEAEAIGRNAVRLSRTGDYVSFKTTQRANSIGVPYSSPDAPV